MEWNDVFQLFVVIGGTVVLTVLFLTVRVKLAILSIEKALSAMVSFLRLTSQ